MDTLRARGTGRLFGPGTSTQDIVGYIGEWYAGVHGAASLRRCRRCLRSRRSRSLWRYPRAAWTRHRCHVPPRSARGGVARDVKAGTRKSKKSAKPAQRGARTVRPGAKASAKKKKPARATGGRRKAKRR